jgi:hypothetical protein
MVTPDFQADLDYQALKVSKVMNVVIAFQDKAEREIKVIQVYPVYQAYEDKKVIVVYKVREVIQVNQACQDLVE